MDCIAPVTHTHTPNDSYASGLACLVPQCCRLLSGCNGDTRARGPHHLPGKTVTELPPSALTPASPEAKPERRCSHKCRRAVGHGQGPRHLGDKDLPERKAVEVNDKHVDYNFCMKNGEFLDETFIVDAKTRGLKNMFVWLAPADKDGKLAIHPDRAKIAPKRREGRHRPAHLHVHAARPGLAGRPDAGRQEHVEGAAQLQLDGRRKSSTAATTRPSPPATSASGRSRPSRATFPVSCTIHPWMRASIDGVRPSLFRRHRRRGPLRNQGRSGGPVPARGRGTAPARTWASARPESSRPITIQPGDNDQGPLEFVPPPTN